MNCVKCSNPLQDKDNFCPECGQKVLKDTTAGAIPCPSTIQDEVRTPEPCGEEIKEGKKFCNQCGWKINPACFLPSAKMCSGMLQNGAPCDNIVTPNVMFCSKCGTPPDFGSSKTEDINSNTNNSNSYPAVVQEQLKLDSAQKSEASTNEYSQLMKFCTVVNENENSLDSNGNSVAICSVVADMKNLSCKDADKSNESNGVRSIKTDKGHDEREKNIQGVFGAPQSGSTGHLDSTKPSSQNKQLNIEEKSRKDFGDPKETSLLNDPLNLQQFGQGRVETTLSSKQPGLNSPVQSSSSAAQGVQQQVDKTKSSQSGDKATTENDVEKSSDIWVPPNGKQEIISTTEYTTTASAQIENKKDKKEGNASEENLEQKVSQGEQKSEHKDKDRQATEEDLEESDSDSDSKSEEDSDKDKGSESVKEGTKSKKRRKQRKKGKEKYLQKQERREKNRANKAVLNKDAAVTSNELTTTSAKNTETKKSDKNYSTPNVATSNSTSKNVSYTSFTYQGDGATSKTPYREIPVHYVQTQQQSNGSNDGKSSNRSSDGKTRSGSSDGKPRNESDDGSSVDPKLLQGNKATGKDENLTSTNSGQKTFASVVSERSDKMTTRSKSDVVEIHFQAIASKKFIDNSAVNSVRIRFALEEYGGLTNLWPTYSVLLPDGHVAVSFRGYFSKERIKTPGFRYCYCVVINNDLSNVVDEYVYNAWKVDENNLRQLQKDNIPDLWMQYDGILNPLPEKAFLQKLKSMVGYDSYEKKMEKDAIFSAKYFFPKWKHFFVHGWDTTGADMLRQMEMLYAGLHKNVFISCKKWTLEEDFKTFLGKVWIEDLKPKLDELEKKPDLISAIGIIVIAEEYLLPLDAKNKNALFQSLVLEADFEEMKCPMYDKFKESFQGVIPRVKKGLLEFIKSVKSSDDPTWLCSLPLYHFLIGKCRPFEAMTKRVDHNAVKPLWWGKDGLEIEMDYLKGKTKWSVDPEIILQTLAPMFEIDFYLSRSFVSVLKLEKLTVVKTKLLPPEVVMAALYFFLRTDYFENDTKKKIAYDCLEVAAEQMRKSCELENISQDQLTRAYLCIKIGADVLSMANSHHRDRTSIVLWATEAFVVALAVYEQLIERTSKEGNSMESERLHLVTLNEKKGLINDWLNRFIFYPSVEADLEVWSKILSMNIPNSSIKDALMSELKDTLQEKLDKKTKLVKEHLITLYFNDADQLYPPAVQEILGQFVNQALDEGCICEENVRYGRGALKLGSMLSRKFEESWGKNHLCKAQPRDILNFTLTWKPFKHFLDMVYQKEKSGVLSQECQVQFTQATSVLQLTLNKLLTGEIEIGDVLLIDNWKDAFYCLNNIIWKSEKNTDLEEELVLQTIKLRCREIQKVKEVQANVGIFVQQCQHFKVDLCEIDKKMESLTNIERMKVLEVCKPATLDKVSNIDNYDPVVNIFNLPPDVLDILPHLKRMSEGVLFFNMWIKQGQREEAKKKSPLTIEEVVENVWQNVKHTWLGLGRKIASGDITFREFQQYFGNIPADNLEEQLSYLPIGKTNDKDWIKERIRQFQQHRILEQCVYGANVILKVVKEYELKGDFEPVKMIDKMVQGAETKMSEFDTSLIDACNVLRGMREEHAKCLEEFINCKQLINWLRKSMESLKELKVFVDLASISAGEGDLEVAKVKCLHAATTGYAPLIFNLGDQCDYLKLLEKCQLVWKELKADPHLPTKLRDTSRHLEWLKEVKSAQGSVEVTSMKQAEAINSVGIYMVGKVDPDIHKEKPTIDDVLQLHVQKDEQGSRLPRRYQYKELQELQSKLMLVAGKAEQGRDDVERFTIVYDAIVRLCNVYIKLVSSGCVLFTNWQARFLCDPERKVCAFVKFGSGEGCIQLKGRRSEDDDVSTVIPKLAKFMENCLDEWLKYIEQKRDEYHHLNFCTIDQMVILQKEIVLMGGEVEPSNFIYPLLSNVKHDCTKMDLIGALKKAKGDVFQKEAEQKAELEENVEEEELDSDNENQAKATAIAKFISAIMDSGFSEKLAREALSKGMIEPEEIDEGLVWCVDHEDETEMEVEVSEEQVEVIVEDYEGWTKSEMSISIMTQNILSDLQKNTTAADTLIPDLEQLWEEFLSSISSSVSDYLSVEHLGIILRRLAETETFTVNRPFLSCFKRGEPNLLLCQQDEILNTVLTIYSYDPDQPLPQSDEILMCTPHTTLDEVEIFWRRAVLDTTNRIHCLVNGDLLDYEVSDKGERRLDHHMQKAVELDIPYKLVVVCSTEREYHSRIVAALDKYRRPPLPLMTHNNMTKYIKDKLTFDIRRPSATPAAEADFEHCTVRVVKSWRAGVGKSLHKKRLAEKLHGLHGGVIRSKKAVVSIPLHEREINIDDIMGVLLDNTLHPGKIEPRLFHIDLSHEVQEGVDYLLFQLLILGCLTNSTGHVWRKLPYDLYIVETMPLLARDYQEQRGYIKCMHRCLDILPDVTCRSPQESLKKYQGNAPNIGQNDLLFDGKEFESNVFQRPFQYLYRLDMNRGLGDVDMRRTEGNPQTCLQTLLKHCGIRDPSWAELRHFVWFLNTQLVDFENSAFLGLAAAKDLPGFSQFVLRFLIQMSRDFATRSLNMSEESPIQMLQRMDTEEEEDEEDVLHQFQLRRTWESSPHPYLFFNPDHNSMTFLGFNIERQTGNLIDVQTGTVLERGIMQRNLQNALTRNRVPINENFDNLPRIQKLIKLCSVMGVEDVFDPDPTYELTTDNVKKILAIYMRFRCDIPVIIMGETGCGKTRLVKFMCQLQCPIGVEVQNMILMKVHGGTRRSDIIRKVLDAERIAQENTANYGQRLYTVLFFDEANTTEAIGLIKEIMCDRSMEGEPLKLCQTLKIVAACNPYRKHSEDLIKRLEQAGLGYHVDADKTTDRMGRVPMRRLVYRVQPLPQSMLPLVWDFGQLDTNVEEMYIKQMVLRYIRGGKLPDEPNLDTTVSHILTSAQEFMRRQQDECSFVSLRDVERVLEVISWFYRQSQGETDLFDLMEEEEEADSEEEEEEEMEDQELAEPQPQTVSDLTKSLVLALGVCYHACLKNREEFRKEMVNVFRHPCVLPKFGNQRGAKQMFDIITRCQNIFLEIDNLGANIAKNQALRENVFMMVVCIELRIPLFLVGKPGSSKSLAKTIVADAMQGNAAHTEIYRNYKQVQMVSFQCSPLSVPEGIVGTFRQCAMYQKDKDLNRFVSVVVLDEVGLAEDSPRMPLKTLHPLLEDGCQGDEKPEEHKKVAFIGISNWALDPAKMNRGILVQREVPDLEELEDSADGICSGDRRIKKMIKPLIKPLAESYLQVFQSVIAKREFFGLRDFYSLIKMVYSFAEKNNKKPTWLMLQHCIKRNFGGFEHSADQDPLAVFSEKLKTVEKILTPSPGDPDCTPAGLIEACLQGDGVDSDTRYLLLLTENYGALTVLQQKIQTMKNAITIFGSSFPSDQEYTQVCRNINRIKICMETGKTVVLLNLENLYESLYDALNQYYVYFGGERYVDLGLGTHRVKCRVHKNFRLIVVAEKEVVYSKFPIPLINRLEKHFLNISTMLSPVQVRLAQKLQNWAEDFVKTTVLYLRNPREKKSEYKTGDVFMGFHADTCASIILHISQKYSDDDLETIEQEVQNNAVLEFEKDLVWDLQET